MEGGDDILWDLWTSGGSPATEQIDAGIETVDLETVDQSSTKNTTSSETEQDNKDGSEVESAHVTQDTIKKWWQFLDNKLWGYKQEKMKRKLPVNTQLLNCAQDELTVKKRLQE